MGTLKNLTGLTNLVIATEAKEKPVSVPVPTMKSLADIIARQMNAKESAGDKEIAAAKAKNGNVSKHLGLAKLLMNTRPEIVIDKAIKEQTNADKAGELVAAPIVSLKALVAKSKQEFEDSYNTGINDINDINNMNGNGIIIPGMKELEYDEWQDKAIYGMMHNQYACVIGAAGTGKTTSLLKFVEAIEDEIETVSYIVKDGDREVRKYKPAIAFVSFTGRAVEQMKKRLPEKYHGVCGTIHGDVCLTYIPEFYEELNIETGLMKDKMRFIPSYGPSNKLPYRILVIDETGMLAVDLWNILIGALRSDCRVYMLGDINQLPPVYGKSILGFAMTKWPTFELKTIHRQAKNNPIIANAHNILNGLNPQQVKDRFDLVDIGHIGSEETQVKMIGIIKHLHKKGSFDPIKDGFIVPQNKGPIGQLQFNELLTPYFNPEKGLENKRYLIKTGIALAHHAVGDKVMLLQNDKENNLTNGQIGIIVNIASNGAYKNLDNGLTHADLNRMHNTTVDENSSFELESESIADFSMDEENVTEEDANQRQASHIVTARFGEFDWDVLREYNTLKMIITGNYVDSSMLARYAQEYKLTMDGQEVNPMEIVDRAREQYTKLDRILQATSREVSFSTAGMFRKLAPAYAFTCHKSQGGEYPVVVILLHSANSRLLSREWLYTAVTRAQKRIIIVYNQRGMMLALKNQRVKGNNLKEKIQSFVKVSEEDAMNNKAIVPNLPERKGTEK